MKKVHSTGGHGSLNFVTSLDKLLNFSVSQFLYLTRQEVAIAFR